MDGRKGEGQSYSELSPEKKAEMLSKYVRNLQELHKSGKTNLYGGPDPNLFSSKNLDNENWQTFEHPHFRRPPIVRARNVKGIHPTPL